MLHTALVISAYMSMIFIPCACAQWGEVLTAEWRNMRRDLRLDMRRRRDGMSEALIRSLREARAAAQIAALAKVAFVEPAPLPRIIYRARKLHLGRPRARVRTADPVFYQRAIARVRERLCMLSESFRLANNIFAGPMPAMAMAGPSISLGNMAPPMVNFAPRRYKETAAPVAPAAAKPIVAKPEVKQPEVALPAIAAKITQPTIAAEDKLTKRLFDQVGAFRRPANTIAPKQIVAGKIVPQELVAPREIAPQEIKPVRFASMPAAIEPSPLLHFPPSAAELEALFALDSHEAVSSDAVPVALQESSVKISAAA